MDQGVDEIKLKVNELESKFKTSDEPSNTSGQANASRRDSDVMLSPVSVPVQADNG